MAEPIIRKARQEDAVHLAALVDIAGEGLPVHLWQHMAAEGQSPVEFGRARAMREEGGFTYRNAHMLEVDGEIAGGLISYRLGDQDHDLSDVPPLVRGLVELEMEVSGYWYVNVVAVYPEYRGRGLGTLLLDHADTLGREAGCDGTAIIVASGNAGANRLYERQGYRTVARRPAPDYLGGRAGQEWILLAKTHS